MSAVVHARCILGITTCCFTDVGAAEPGIVTSLDVTDPLVTCVWRSSGADIFFEHFDRIDKMRMKVDVVWWPGMRPDED